MVGNCAKRLEGRHETKQSQGFVGPYSTKDYSHWAPAFAHERETKGELNTIVPGRGGRGRVRGGGGCQTDMWQLKNAEKHPVHNQFIQDSLNKLSLDYSSQRDKLHKVKAFVSDSPGEIRRLMILQLGGNVWRVLRVLG